MRTAAAESWKYCRFVDEWREDQREGYPFKIARCLVLYHCKHELINEFIPHVQLLQHSG